MTAIADERAGGWILSAEQPIVEFHEGSRRHDARLLAQEPPQLVADTKPSATSPRAALVRLQREHKQLPPTLRARSTRGCSNSTTAMSTACGRYGCGGAAVLTSPARVRDRPGTGSTIRCTRSYGRRWPKEQRHSR
jgi:hypothetical protein